MHAHKFLGLPKKNFLEFLPTYCELLVNPSLTQLLPLLLLSRRAFIFSNCLERKDCNIHLKSYIFQQVLWSIQPTVPSQQQHVFKRKTGWSPSFLTMQKKTSPKTFPFIVIRDNTVFPFSCHLFWVGGPTPSLFKTIGR